MLSVDFRVINLASQYAPQSWQVRRLMAFHSLLSCMGSPLWNAFCHFLMKIIVLGCNPMFILVIAGDKMRSEINRLVKMVLKLNPNHEKVLVNNSYITILKFPPPPVLPHHPSHHPHPRACQVVIPRLCHTPTA